MHVLHESYGQVASAESFYSSLLITLHKNWIVIDQHVYIEL